MGFDEASHRRATNGRFRAMDAARTTAGQVLDDEHTRTAEAVQRALDAGLLHRSASGIVSSDPVRVARTAEGHGVFVRVAMMPEGDGWATTVDFQTIATDGRHREPTSAEMGLVPEPVASLRLAARSSNTPAANHERALRALVDYATSTMRHDPVLGSVMLRRDGLEVVTRGNTATGTRQQTHVTRPDGHRSSVERSATEVVFREQEPSGEVRTTVLDISGASFETLTRDGATSTRAVGPAEVRQRFGHVFGG